MDINIVVETAGYRLISSGTLLTCDSEPIRMTVEIAGEKTVNVQLHFHPEKHPDGKSLLRQISEDRTEDNWHIYESIDGECGRTIAPVPVICYQDREEMKTLYLQILTQKVSEDGTVKVDYSWFETITDNLVEGLC